MKFTPCFAAFACIACVAYGQVLMAHGDLAATATTTVESTLTPSNVTSGKFGRLRTFTCGGGSDYIFAQPLVSASTGNMYVATLASNVCKFSTGTSTTAVWTKNFGTGRTGWSNNSSQFFYCAPASCAIGIVGTPVVDETDGFLMFVVATGGGTPVYTLTKLNLSDGSTAASQVIAASVVGTGYTGAGGDNTSGANLLFKADWSNQRPGLVLSPDRSKVYVVFGGGSAGGPSFPPWHGWIIAYATSNLSQVGVFCTTPNGWGGSLWSSPAFDASGNLYIASGSEGDWDGVTEFSDTVFKLSSTLSLLDWMTPSNHVTNDANDYDLGSNWVRVISGSGGNQYVVSGGKDFQVYSISTTCMGHLQGSGFGGCSVQQFHTDTATVTQFSGSYAGVFMNNVLFLPVTSGDLYAFTWVPSTGLFTTTPLWHQVSTYGFPGPAQMTGSCNGTSNCILWVVTSPTNTYATVGAGTLRAINPTNGAELWNSGSSLGSMTKFASPSVVNGQVFVSTQSGVIARFDLIPSTNLSGQVTITGRVVLQ